MINDHVNNICLLHRCLNNYLCTVYSVSVVIAAIHKCLEVFELYDLPKFNTLIIYNYRPVDHFAFIFRLLAQFNYTFWLNEYRTNCFAVLIARRTCVFAFISWTDLIDRKNNIPCLLIIRHFVFV